MRVDAIDVHNATGAALGQSARSPQGDSQLLRDTFQATLKRLASQATPTAAGPLDGPLAASSPGAAAPLLPVSHGLTAHPMNNLPAHPVEAGIAPTLSVAKRLAASLAHQAD